MYIDHREKIVFFKLVKGKILIKYCTCTILQNI